MRLLIDLQGAQSESRYRGIGRYSLALAQAMIERAGEQHEIWIALNGALPQSMEPIRAALRGLLPTEHIRVFDLPRPVAARDGGNTWRRRAAELIRDDFIATLAPDAVLVTSLFEGFLDDACVSVGALHGAQPFTAVLHYDLIPMLMPQHYLTQSSMRAYYERQVASLMRADLLLAISEHSRQEVITALDIPPGKVCTILSAADPMFAPVTARHGSVQPYAAARGISRPMVLCAPGGFDPRKNIERLIQAYALLPTPVRNAHQLVIASRLADGQRRHLQSVAEAAGLRADELVLTGYVGDEDLLDLYRSARLFVFPSLHEGFGLPLLEAMCCGAPVIGANTSSIPEVIGRDDALFDPHSSEAIASLMGALLTDSSRLAELRAHCLERAAMFSWSRTADLAIAAIESAVRPAAPLPVAPVSANHPAPGLSQQLCGALAAVDAPSTHADWLQAARAIAFHHPPQGRRQLLVDVTEIARTDARTGIQRVVRALLLQLLQRPPSDHVVVPVRFDGRGYRAACAFAHAMLEQAGMTDVAANWQQPDAAVDLHQDDVYFSLDLSPMTDAMRASHLRMHALGLRCCFVVYDILPIRHPHWWPAGGSESHRRWLESIVPIAYRLACISQAVADDVEAWIAELPGRGARGITRSFHLGAEIASSNPSRGLAHDAPEVLDTISSAPSFLMVGTLEPRKGHAQVLDAMELLWAQGHVVNLVIVGKQGWLVDRLVQRLRHHLNARQRLFWLEGISDEYLDLVYAKCSCLIAASEGEGFGLPLIEAARHGIPIIARDIPVFREVAGDHALYFSGPSAHDVLDAIKRWRTLQPLGLAPASSGMPRIDWEESARQLLHALDLTTDHTPSQGRHTR
jgi:glycosyltransferase involved in cell wall biosynthesis